MAIDNRAASDGQDRTANPHSRLFTVRLWREDVVGGLEYRGSVVDVVGEAFRNFRDWSDLVAFMIARLEEGDSAQLGTREEERDGK